MGRCNTHMQPTAKPSLARCPPAHYSTCRPPLNCLFQSLCLSNSTAPALLQILTFVLLFLLSFSGFLVSDVPVYFRCGQLAAPSRATAVLGCAGGSALQQLVATCMPGRGATQCLLLLLACWLTHVLLMTAA